MPIDEVAAEPIVDENIDAPEVETEEAEQPVTDEDNETDASAEVPEVAGDGRVVPKYIKALQESDPAAYKKAKEAFFQHRDFIAAFPDGPNAAKDVLKVMADIGGSEGLASMQQRATQLDQLAELARTNPAAVVDEILNAAPGGEEAVAVKAVSNWYQKDPESYDRMMSGVVAQSLANAKVDPMMEKISLLLEVGRQEDAIKTLNQLREQLGAFGQAAAAQPKPKQGQADPNDARAKELDTREAQMFDNSLGGSIIAYRDPLIFKEAEQWTKGMTLNDRQKGTLVRDVTSEIGTLLEKDQKWMTEYRAAVGKRDQKEALRLYTEKAGKIAPEIVKNVSRELFGSPVSAVRKPAPAVVKPVARPVVPTPARKVDPFDAIFNS